MEKPATASCTVKIVDEKFDDFTPYTSTFTPPADCPGPWNKVVLRMEGKVQGVQYDRLGHLEVGGVTLFKTSTPKRVTGELTGHRLGARTNDSTHALVDGWNQLDTRGGHRLRTAGYLWTSHGLVVTTVEQSVSNESMHRWMGDQENPDALTATWSDSSTVTVFDRGLIPIVSRSDKRFTLDGRISVSPENRLTTTISLHDEEDARTTRWPLTLEHRELSDLYTGEAAYTMGVPRAQRNAVGTSTQRYRLTGERGACHDRSISTRNGTVTEDVQHCD